MVAQTADVWQISKGNNKKWQTSFEAFLKTFQPYLEGESRSLDSNSFIVHDIIISYSLFNTVILKNVIEKKILKTSNCN